MPRVVFEEIIGAAGYYDREGGAILVDSKRPREVQASTIMHEFVHSISGDTRCPDESKAEENRRELAADRLAARIRIPFGALVEAFTRFKTMEDRQKFLCCDEDELYARVMGMSSEERDLFEICARKCIGLRTKQARRGYPGPLSRVRPAMSEFMMGA